MYVCMYVCIGIANQVSMVLKSKAQRNVSLYLTLCIYVFIYALREFVSNLYVCMLTESNMYV